MLLSPVYKRAGLVTVLVVLLAVLGTACAGAQPTATQAPEPTEADAPTEAPAAEEEPTEAPEPTEEPTEAAEPTEAPTEAPAGEAVTVRLICRCVEGGVNSNFVAFFKDYIKPNFEEQMQSEGKNVTVEITEFGGSDEALKEQYALDLRVGEGDDVMAFDGFWIPEFVEGDLLRPLSDIAGDEAANWEGWDHISPGLQQLLGYQGERYGIAQGTDVRQVFYRRDLFEEAGIETPWQPTSWQELLDTARTLKQELPDVMPLQVNAGTAMGEATTMQGWDMVLLGTGTHMYDFEENKWVVDDPGIQQALDFYETVYIEEELGDARLQLLQDGRERSFAEFRDGNIAILIEGDWFWRSVLAEGSEWELENRNELVGWAKMPAREPGQGFNGQDFVTISGGTGHILNPNTEHPEEAWALLSFMYSRDTLMEFQEIEPRIRVRDDVPVTGDEVMTNMADELLPLTTVRPQLPDYPKVSTEAQLATERVVSGEMTPEESQAAYADAVRDIVGEDNVVGIDTIAQGQ